MVLKEYAVLKRTVGEPKIITLFAAYDKQGIIRDYVIYYLKALSRLSDVYYMADGMINENEFIKIMPYTKEQHALPHGKYDFGSWQELIKHISWEVISQYDVLILVNDSCFGPIFPLEDVFVKMDNQEIDFWGMTQNNKIRPHLQSYFFVFKNHVIRNPVFQTFFNNIRKEQTVDNVIVNYEIGLTETLVSEGFTYQAVLEENMIFKKRKERNLMRYWRSSLKGGVPLLKMRLLTMPTFAKEDPFDIENYIQTHFSYDFNLVKKSCDLNMSKLKLRYALQNKHADRYAYSRSILPEKIPLKRIIAVFPYIFFTICLWINKLSGNRLFISA